MDFVRLGLAYSSTYIPDKLIEGYNSLIWKESYDEFGEFELKSFDIVGMLTTLPEDTLVSHLETKEVMQVETHEINMVGEGVDARPEITVKGRSALTILTHRYIKSSYQKKRKFRKAYTAVDALSVLLYQAVDNVSGHDVTRGDDDPDTWIGNDFSWTTLDAIPNVHVTESVASEGTARWWNLEWGLLWPQFQKMLQDADLGIRLIRPVSPNPGTTVTVSSILATRGDIVTNTSSDLPGLQFNLYKGVDRTATVKFTQLQGHLEKPQYLKSKMAFKSMVEIMSGMIGVSDVYRNSTEQAYSGWKRRAMVYDAGTPELPDKPEAPDPPASGASSGEKADYEDDLAAYKTKLALWKNKRDDIYDKFTTENQTRALRELKVARRVNMVQGDISSSSPYKYKVHYDLGDRVTLVGEYGITSTMIVQEYVRTQDSTGDRGFPGLVEP